MKTHTYCGGPQWGLQESHGSTDPHLVLAALVSQPINLFWNKNLEPVKQLVIKMDVNPLKWLLIWAMYCDDVDFSIILYTVFKSLVIEQVTKGKKKNEVLLEFIDG